MALRKPGWSLEPFREMKVYLGQWIRRIFSDWWVLKKKRKTNKHLRAKMWSSKKKEACANYADTHLLICCLGTDCHELAKGEDQLFFW